MGRHRKHPVSGGGVVKEQAIGSRTIETAVEERLGLLDNVCMSCNARVDSSLDKCRKCGSKELRPKAYHYRGKGSNGR